VSFAPYALHDGGPVDGDALRKVCGSFATGVTVVTSGRPGTATGTTVNSFTSVSLDPPLVLFCLHRRSRLYPVLRETDGFVVNVLSHQQEALAWAFAGRGPTTLDDVPHDWSPAGLPVLRAALASLTCRLVTEYDGGDHWILLGQVVDMGAGDGADRPLIFYQGAMCPLG